MAVTTVNGTTQIRDNTVTPAKVTVGVIIADGTHAFTGDQSLGGFKITNLGTPSASTDAATKAYVDAAVIGLLDFKGSIDASASPNYVAASKGDSYVISVAGKVGGASGKSVDVGDLLVASADNAGGTEASVGTSWFVVEHNLVGAALTSGTLAQFAATTSAQLAGVISDETGTDKLVFSASPDLTGTPTAPTAAPGTNTTQLATTAFVTAALGGTMVNRETPSGTVNGSNVTFTLAFTPISGTEMVFVNGILQDAGSGNDYTISTVTITFLTGAIPQTGDKIRVTYWK